MILDELIYDRTETDLYNDTDKAYIDYHDLNRIETAVQYISQLLNSMGYTNTTNNKLDWDIRDLRTVDQVNRIKNNYTQIKNAFDRFSLPDFEWASITEANQIEYILWDIYMRLKDISRYFIQSGVANAGQDRVWQQRFRRGSNIARLNSKVAQYEQPWYTVTTPSVEVLSIYGINDLSKISETINTWNDYMENLDSEVGDLNDI